MSKPFQFGLVTMIIGTILSVLSMYSDPTFSIKKIDFWGWMFLTNFLTGYISIMISKHIKM